MDGGLLTYVRPSANLDAYFNGKELNGQQTNRNFIQTIILFYF